jgi:uncharacterized protein (TIGR02118 family)
VPVTRLQKVVCVEELFLTGGDYMFQLTVLYGHPQDSTAFDRYYNQTHAPLALKLPGLKGYTANKPMSLNPQEPTAYYLIAELYFESIAAMQAAFQSPEGQAAVADTQNFATGGLTLLAGEVQVYDPVSVS